MITEHRGFPPIPNTLSFDARGNGPLIDPLTLMVALTPSHDYPPTRITLCTVVGTTTITAHQAATLRDQLQEALTLVIAACPEMATPDEFEHLPKEMPRG